MISIRGIGIKEIKKEKINIECENCYGRGWEK